ncbi:MAG TPA: lipid-binding SYLF domain-containing protein [Candidatus Limnocylindria bacterium]|nr:lipid-binding SYLF domain-containing protein [Candidatus Limnocylindria bacterium]
MKLARSGIAALLLAMPLVFGVAQAALTEDQLAKRLADAGAVYQELVRTPDRGIPEALHDKCKCVAVFPHVYKGAIGFGARHGNGVATCRDAAGHWSPVAFLKLTGGSWGLQLGATATDVVLFFMTERGAQSLLESKFTLGANAGVAAGPVGRTAEASTDLKLEAEIYSYARSKGLFAGLSLEGARLAADEKANRQFYGAPVSAKALLFEHGAPRRPPEGEAFLGLLP